MKPTAVRFREESKALFLLLGYEALAEGRHVVSVDGKAPTGQKVPTTILLATWERSGWGRALFEDDGYTTHAGFEFSAKGLRRVKILRIQHYFLHILGITRRQGLNIVVAITSLIAAVAACASAYFSYLALSAK
ncbi:hypothetical protein [Sphingobium sp.]|uniref:hypothetical protein n=1 Tax=Sphingobium sp. TaxID=1912891 RepID=UPI0025CB9021|nr:hypothetical protein [Sphingobium sp.]